MTVTANVTLTRNLTCTGPGLIIGANNITINLGGHTITGTGPGTTIGIHAEGRTNLRIHNGTITGFRQAVALYRTRNVVLRGLRITGNAPITSAYAGALYVDESENVDILDSRLIQPEAAQASWVSASSDVRMERVQASGSLTWVTSSDAIVTRSVVTSGSLLFATSTQRASIRHNVLRRASVFTSEVSSVTIADNRFVGPTRVAIGLTITRGPVVERNVVTGAETGLGMDALVSNARIMSNFFADNGYGVHMIEPDLIVDNLLIADNIFAGNHNAGVFLEAARIPRGDTPLTVSRNTFVRNGHRSTDRDSAGRRIDDGIHTNLPVGSLLTISHNRTYVNADHGIEALPAGSVIDGGGNRSTGDPNGCAGVACA